MNRTTLFLFFSTGVNTLIAIGLAFVFGIFPFCYVVANLSDPAFRGPGIPRSAQWIHKRLSPRMETWARERVASHRARALTVRDLRETEWPLFGGAFYLWATEAMERPAKESPDPVVNAARPSFYAAGAIGATTALMVDPGQASWVQQHWGDEYLEVENVFYRMLLLSGMQSHRTLTGSTRYDDAIAVQTKSLMADISASPHGLLEDYPNECYPGDVLAAITALARSGKFDPEGMDDFLDTARRGFEGDAVDQYGLPPYLASASAGMEFGGARGCSNSYLLFLAPEVWPDKAQAWYTLHEEHFWQDTGWMAGVREYPRAAEEPEWQVGDMDAGPILGGYGMAACAFALAAARSNGRYDHAYPLAAEMLAASWPLPDGTLLLPRILSSSTDAPYLGEAAILFNLTRQPVGEVPIKTGGRIPGLVYGILAIYVAGSAIVLFAAWQRFRQLRRYESMRVLWPRVQIRVWTVLILAAVIALCFQHAGWALLLMLFSQFFPKVRLAA